MNVKVRIKDSATEWLTAEEMAVINEWTKGVSEKLTESINRMEPEILRSAMYGTPMSVEILATSQNAESAVKDPRK